MNQESTTIVVPPGSLSRPLGNLEVFFKTLADLGAPLGHEHWAVHLALRLSFESSDIEDPEPHLRRAWQIIRQQYPAIGSTISPVTSAHIDEAKDPENLNATSSRETLKVTPFDADGWLNDTFQVNRDHSDANALFTDLRPSAWTMCYWLPTSSELVIRSSHWRLDGIGMVMLGHGFLKVLAEVLLRRGLQVDPHVGLPFSGVHPPSSFAQPPQPLPQNLEVLASLARKPRESDTSDFVQTCEAGADALVAEFLRGVPSIGLPTRPNSEQTPPGASARAEVRLHASQTAKVTTARREQGFSFTGAVHAAIVRVTAGFPQHSLSKAYAAFFPVDLRKSIAAAAPVSENELLFGLYFSGLPICVENPAAKGFQEIAREMTVVYGRDLENFWTDPNGKTVSLLQLAEPYLTRTTALFSAPVPEGLPPTQTPDLSSLGRVEAYLQSEYQSTAEAPRVKVTDVWLSTEMLNRSVQFHVWSWKDELHIGASFNKSFYEHSFVVEVLEKIVKELLQGLGIEEL